MSILVKENSMQFIVYVCDLQLVKKKYQFVSE